MSISYKCGQLHCRCNGICNEKMKRGKIMTDIPKISEVLSENRLFAGLSQDEICSFAEKYGSFVTDYDRGEYIMRAGDIPSAFGIVLSGKVTAYGHGRDGGETVISVLSAGDHFADILVSAGKKESPVSLFVEENGTEVFNISLDRIFLSRDGVSNTVLKNLLEVISLKYWDLFKKIEYTSVLSLKKRICLYLSDISASNGSSSFYINFDREGLSSYLNADRSALCRVLSSLKKEGIIEYRKNFFEIKDPEKLRSITG